MAKSVPENLFILSFEKLYICESYLFKKGMRLMEKSKGVATNREE